MLNLLYKLYKLQNEKNCLETKIVDYKTSKTDKNISTIRHGFNLLKRSKELAYIRKKVILEKSHSDLDNDFFAHMEEIDLCWRILSRGYKIVYEPKSEVFHLGGATLSKTNPHKTFLNFRNNLFLLYKNLPKHNFYQTIFARLILDGIAAIKFLLSFEFRNFCAVFTAHLQFYLSISKLKSKRKNNLLLTTTILHTTMYNKSIVADFFYRGKKYFSDLHFNP